MLNLMSFSPSNFGRYVSQTESGGNETNDTNDWIPSSTTTTANDIPSFMPIPTTPIMPTNVPQKLPIPSTTIRDDVERLPFPQHGPGPIQRPNKLTCPPAQPTYLMNSIQSPNTPDVLDQISRLINHQNSTSTATTPNMNNSSMPISDLSTPNLPWTTFSSAEWPPKYESTWPLTNIQSPTVPLTNQAQNPFALISAMNEQPGQSTREEATVWSSALGTVTPRLASTSARTQRASTWNELFQSTVPSSTEATRPLNGSMLKYWYAPDPSSADVVTSNGHVTETANPFWSMGTPSMSNQAQVPPTAWWPNSSSDENNNKSQTNPHHHHHHHLDDDSANNRDQSRWDFAR